MEPEGMAGFHVAMQTCFKRQHFLDFDVVEESVSISLEHEQVRRCLDGLTDIQREAIVLAYYQGHTYGEVAELLDANQATVKTRMRDGLIRLRDCMGVQA